MALAFAMNSAVSALSIHVIRDIYHGYNALNISTPNSLFFWRYFLGAVLLYIDTPLSPLLGEEGWLRSVQALITPICVPGSSPARTPYLSSGQGFMPSPDNAHAATFTY